MSPSHEESSEQLPDFRKTDELLAEVEQIAVANSQKYTWTVPSIYKPLCRELRQHADQIDPKVEPTRIPELFLTEAARRLRLEASYMEWGYGHDNSTLEEIVDLIGIPERDLVALEPWLREHLDAVRDANERLFRERRLNQRILPPKNIDYWDNETKAAVDKQIEKFREVIFPMYEDEPGMKLFTERFLVAPIINPDRSSFISSLSHTVAIDARSVVFLQNRGKSSRVVIDPVAFTLHWGEECFGHGRHYSFAEEAPTLPAFLKTKGGHSTDSTIESVGQYFANVLTERVIGSPELYTKLGFEIDHGDLMTYYHDRRLMEAYFKNLEYLHIYNAARYKNDFDRRTIAEMTKPYSLDPDAPLRYLDKLQRYKNGAVHHTESIRLQYADRTVDRIITAASDGQKNDVERLILYGFWTPPGLRQLAKIALDIEVDD